MLLYIDDVLKQSKYLGHKQDCSTKPGSKWVHLFETKIQGDKSWIVVKEYQDGTKMGQSEKPVAILAPVFSTMHTIWTV